MSTTISNYCPSPIDTSDITLPTELFALADDIAKNVHEVWAQQRIKEGWVYGPQRINGKYVGAQGHTPST